MNIFFDLDGTLLDSRERLYSLFQHLVPESNLSFDEYWEIKRNKIGHKDILKSHFFYSDESFFSFEQTWMNQIEASEWLKFDRPFEGIYEYLLELKNNNNRLYVVTARQYTIGAINQIKESGFDELFEEILVTQQKKEKSDLIRDAVTISADDWIVGDTGKDIQTGKSLGINTAAVLSGFLNRQSLEGYNPDVIANQVIDLKFQ